MMNENIAPAATDRCRVVCWTKRDGVTNVSPDLSRDEAFDLARTTVDASPNWLQVDVEIAHDDGTCTPLARRAWTGGAS